MINNYGIDMIFVNSTNLSEIGYDQDNQVLYVRFISNNALYMLRGVPIAEFEGLKNASSIGSYYNSSIKNSYPYERLE